MRSEQALKQATEILWPVSEMIRVAEEETRAGILTERLYERLKHRMSRESFDSMIVILIAVGYVQRDRAHLDGEHLRYRKEQEK